MKRTKKRLYLAKWPYMITWSLVKFGVMEGKNSQYSVLASFYNFSINTGLPALTNPCNTAVIKKIFKRPLTIQWQIVDKEAVDEIIFRTMNTRNRLILELMARGGMRVGEILNLMPVDIQETCKAEPDTNLIKVRPVSLNDVRWVEWDYQ